MHVVIIIILILAILLVIFTLQNSIEISINAFLWEINEVPLVLVLLSCVLIGYLIGAVYFYPRIWNLKKQNRKLSKSSNEPQQQHILTDQTKQIDEEDAELNDEDDESFFKE